MSNNPPPINTNQTFQALAAANAAAAATANHIAAISGRVFGTQIGPQLKLWDYAYEPQHPDDWTTVKTRDLEEGELFEVHKWLRLMSNQPYDTITHYTPALSMLVYFERTQDAAMFKLAWGGE
ncbi:hypothetical protein [Sphingomonas sp. Leaf28]|uniref:hypothetical protein n=1 Tax=Sphingomonas sp. Leaf28 TaxID=1735695 RepID=UPI000AA916E4|nr:hypothetical protein [Sphingomonas sp. Leaf28]